MTIRTGTQPAGSFTMKINGFVVLIPFTFTANRVVLTQGQNVTVPSGGALAIYCSTIQEVAGFV